MPENRIINTSKGETYMIPAIVTLIVGVAIVIVSFSSLTVKREYREFCDG